MSDIKLSAIEKEMAAFDFDELNDHKSKAIAGIASAKSAEDVKEKICAVWKKIGKFVKLAEAVPVVGKFIKVLAELLDTLCG